MLALKLIMTGLCALGLYASVFMYRKALADRAGLLAEPSVVQRPAARLLFGVPNAALGIAYYVFVGIAIWFASGWMWIAVFAAVAAAAVMSIYLAYSLLRITKMACPYCWTGHAVNWLLALFVWIVFKLS